MERLVQRRWVATLVVVFVLQTLFVDIPSVSGYAGGYEADMEPVNAVPTAPAPDAPLPAAPSERADLRSASTRTFENPDGSFTSELFSYPIHYQPADADEEWVPIELGFTASDDSNTVAESSKAPVAVSIGANKAAGGFLTLDADGQRIAFSLPAVSLQLARSSSPTFENNRAEWKDFLPGVDLRVIAGALGAKSFLTLHEPPVVPAWTFLIDAPGLSAALQDDGSVLLSSADKTAVARIPQPYAVDSSVSEELGGGEMTDQVALAVAEAGRYIALTESP